MCFKWKGFKCSTRLKQSNQILNGLKHPLVLRLPHLTIVTLTERKFDGGRENGVGCTTLAWPYMDSFAIEIFAIKG